MTKTQVRASRGGTAPDAVRDQVDVIVEHWCRENPDLDMSTKMLAIRLLRAAHHLERALRREFGEFDIEMWEFEVLMALRRAEGHRMSAGALQRASQVTSGAITNRVARLEQRGWVRRDIDPHDRRQVLVSLTEQGEARAEQLHATKTESEQQVFAGLDRDTIERMSADLRTLLVSLEGPADDDLEPPVLAPHRPPDLPD
ncbi:MAG: MarR family transcriptional regulator [Acidimicrobiaceae bacterium]|nr:MarR family transcriptional regulator [Acidimicrobiaceae bacterium]